VNYSVGNERILDECQTVMTSGPLSHGLMYTFIDTQTRYGCLEGSLIRFTKDPLDLDGPVYCYTRNPEIFEKRMKIKCAGPSSNSSIRKYEHPDIVVY